MKITKPNQDPADKLLEKHIEYRPILGNVPGLNVGLPLGGIPRATYANPVTIQMPANPIPIPGADLQKAVNYSADYGGCGLWRMHWPEHYLNAYQKAVITSSTTMILEPRFYRGLGAVKLQRQATPVQAQFVKFLKMASKEYGFKVIYEIDDIVFRDDIPDYNRCKDSFKDQKIVDSIMEMMQIADEISVPSEFMRQYYIEKTGNKNVTVIPNYPPRNWIDRYYNPDQLVQRFKTKQPRIGYLGSGTHFDVENRTGMKDDFHEIVNHIIRTRKDFKWVFVGGHPLQVKPFISSGEMEFYPWVSVYEYPKKMYELNLNAVIAPLQNNTFNRAKSNIKFLEAACLGIPGVFQNLEPYIEAPVKFDSADEMVSKLKRLLNDIAYYKDISEKSRKYAETMWLENHLDEHYELYFTPFASDNRKYLLENNPATPTT